MKKLLFFLLIALIFSSISAGTIQDEWNHAKQTCAKVKSFLKKYGVYNEIVRLLTNGAKTSATNYCNQHLPSGVCSSIITVVGRLTKKINDC